MVILILWKFHGNRTSSCWEKIGGSKTPPYVWSCSKYPMWGRVKLGKSWMHKPLMEGIKAKGAYLEKRFPWKFYMSNYSQCSTTLFPRCKNHCWLNGDHILSTFANWTWKDMRNYQKHYSRYKFHGHKAVIKQFDFIAVSGVNFTPPLQI